jgi:hypothetical protein
MPCACLPGAPVSLRMHILCCSPISISFLICNHKSLATLQGCDLAHALKAQLNMHPERLKLVHGGRTLDVTGQRQLSLKAGGATLGHTCARHVIAVNDPETVIATADTLLAAPQRKVHTSDRIKRAAAEVAGIFEGETEDDPDVVFRVPQGAQRGQCVHAPGPRNVPSLKAVAAARTLRC